jgi:polyisoprenyl-teichoic acid--peptidoglycan teichoic acid transferase
MSYRGPDQERRRGGHGRIWFGALVLLILMGSGYTGFVLALKFSPEMLPGNEIRAPQALAGIPGLDSTVPTERINVLVMGIDHRPGKPDEYRPRTANAPTDPGRSDTMAVISINPQTKTAGVLSIPRDLWLEVPDGHGGWNMDRINEPFHSGEVSKVAGGGGALASEAIKRNFGIPIDYYVDIDFNGFMALVDGVGGIDIEIPSALTATVLPKNDSGAYEYRFFPGMQHLNGELALAYSRFRLNEEGDFGRIKRQQEVALAARQRILSLGWVDHPLDVWARYNGTLQTNIPAYKLPGLALLIKQIQPANVTARSLGEPGAYREAVIPETGAQVLFPNPDQVARIIDETFADSQYSDFTLAQLQRLYPSGRPALSQNGSGGGVLPQAPGRRLP